MSDRLFHVQVKNRLSELEPLAEKVEQFTSEHGLPPKLAYELNVILDEIITNVTNYGYDDSAEHLIEIRILLADRALTLEIEDDARPFNPLERAAPDLTKPIEERQIGGLGIFFVKKLMDQVSYEYRSGRNCLTLSKQLPV